MDFMTEKTCSAGILGTFFFTPAGPQLCTIHHC